MAQIAGPIDYTGDQFMARKVRVVRKAQPIPKGKRIDVTREEFDHVIDLINKRGDILNNIAHNQEIEFRRMAQLQEEFNALKDLWARLLGKLPSR